MENNFISISVKQSDKFLEEEQKKQQSNNLVKKNFFEIKKGASIFLKIFLNYLQMISIIQSLELKWPFYVRNYMNVYSNIGGVSTQLLSFDCLLQDYEITTKTIYVQTIIALIIPVIIMIISFIVLAALSIKTKKSQQIRLTVIFIVVSIFVQPSIIKSLFDNLSCKEIEGNKYLKANLSINCNSDSHVKWVSKIYKFFLNLVLFIGGSYNLSFYALLDSNISFRVFILFDEK